MKKYLIIILILLIMFTGIIIGTTYSKFYSSTAATISGAIGIWNITLNGTNIVNSEGTVQTFNIQGLSYDESDYVADGKLAPGCSGNFQINVSAPGTQVAVRLDIVADFEELEINTNINVTDIRKMIDGVEAEHGIVQTAENTYTAIIPLADIVANKNNSIIFEFTWENDETGDSDEADSIIGRNFNIANINIPITVIAKQYLGEQIVEYVAPVNTATE